MAIISIAQQVAAAIQGKNGRITWLVNWQRLYHNNQITPGSASYSGGTVTVAGQSIVSTSSSDVALQVATNLNNAFVKPAGAAVNPKTLWKVETRET